jgi:dolichol-phosphate mannosyltransferase
MQKISVVVPVYYNEESLTILHDRLAACAEREPDYDWEFVFVDDGSGDNSLATLLRLAATDCRIRIVKLVRNFGSTTAILAGMAHASGDALAVIAADLQDPPEIILQMLPHWKQGFRSVFAVRGDRADPPSTRWPAAVFNWAFRRFAFGDYPSGGFDCYLIDREVVNVVNECAEKNTFLPGLLMWSGFEHATIHYQRQKREHGTSRWNLQRKLKYFADAFTAFSYFPLRACSALGALVALLGLVYAGVILLSTLLGNIKVEGWSSLMVIVLITSGFQMLMLGLVGEYLWRNFDQTRHRPLYLVDRTWGYPGHVEDDDQLSGRIPIARRDAVLTGQRASRGPHNE